MLFFYVLSQFCAEKASEGLILDCKFLSCKAERLKKRVAQDVGIATRLSPQRLIRSRRPQIAFCAD